MGNHLAKNTTRRAKHQREIRERTQDFISRFDKSHTGTLLRDEVKRAIANTVYDGKLGAVSEEDVDDVLRLGGDTCQPELRAEDLPVALAILASLREYRAVLENLFAQFDVSNTGSLDAAELQALLTYVNDGIVPSKSDVEFVLRQCEPRGKTEPISKFQLKAAVACWYGLKEPTSDKIKEMFRQWDTLGNGVITKGEMAAVMKKLHPDIKDEELDVVFKSTDKNGNGVLEYSEFVDWVMGGSEPAREAVKAATIESLKTQDF